MFVYMSKMQAKMPQRRPKMATTRAKMAKIRPKRTKIRPKMAKMRSFWRGLCVHTLLLERSRKKPSSHLGNGFWNQWHFWAPLPRTTSILYMHIYIYIHICSGNSVSILFIGRSLCFKTSVPNFCIPGCEHQRM